MFSLYVSKKRSIYDYYQNIEIGSYCIVRYLRIQVYHMLIKLNCPNIINVSYIDKSIAYLHSGHKICTSIHKINKIRNILFFVEINVRHPFMLYCYLRPLECFVTCKYFLRLSSWYTFLICSACLLASSSSGTIGLGSCLTGTL